ncbi:MAG TPA: MFS transporter [Candidatus Limnocylindrales bacterium]
MASSTSVTSTFAGVTGSRLVVEVQYSAHHRPANLLGGYRWLAFVLFLASATNTVSLIALPLFAKDRLGMSLPAIAAYFMMVSLANSGVGVIAGRISDRSRRRKLFIAVGFAWLAIGFLLLSVLNSAAALLIVGPVLFAAHGVTGPQLFALAKEMTTREDRPADSMRVTSWLRVAASAGWILGSSLGGVALTLLDSRSIFRASALGELICLLVVVYALPSRTALSPGQPRGVATPDSHPAGHPHRTLALFTLGMVLLSTGRVLRSAMLPILLRDVIGTPVAQMGLILALPPLVELGMMPLAASLASRVGRVPVFLAGAIASIGYYLGLALVSQTWSVAALQVLYACFGSATLVIGIDIAQSMLPDEPGFATALYLAHENLATVGGSAVAAVSTTLLGLHHAFAVPAATSAAGVALLAVVLHAWHSRVSSGSP